MKIPKRLTQFPWRDFQTERKNITFKTLKISKFQKTRENPKKFHAISIALSLSNSTQWKLRGFFQDFDGR